MIIINPKPSVDLSDKQRNDSKIDKYAYMLELIMYEQISQESV